MGHLKLVVDHVKTDYSGPVNLKELFKFIENFIWEKGFDKQHEKDFEQNTPNGKFVEWQISPWKKITDYQQYIIKVRVLGYDLHKTEMIVDDKKSKIDNGRVVIIIDGFVEYDYDNYWSNRPFFFFLRTIYDYFIFKVYTEGFEQRLVHDINHLNDAIERYLNLHRHYAVISTVKH